MKIVTWNCNLNLEKKFDLLQSLTPDIAIIQECEKLEENHFSNCKYFWCGENEKKGLGILVFNRSAKLDNIHNDKLIYFLPVIADDIKILGVWAYNHRAIKFGDNCSGYTSDAINHYSNWLSFNEKIIISGDFNNSVIWDKGNKENNFSNINSKLNSLGLKSSYHEYTNEKFGEESKGTLFHTKKQNKPYLIDYIYYKGMDLNKVDIGQYDEWITLSDHMPVISEFQ